MQSIGGQLRAARESRGLTIPDIEHELCIPAGHLRDLEDDEYANFANLTYGRFFLSRYSDFLKVDTKEFQKEFTVPELGSINDYPYLQEPEEVLRGVGGKDTPKKLKPSARRAPIKASEPTSGQLKSAPLLIASCLGLLAMGLLLLFMRDKAEEFPQETTTTPAGEVKTGEATVTAEATEPSAPLTEPNTSPQQPPSSSISPAIAEVGSSGAPVSDPTENQRPTLPAARPFNPQAPSVGTSGESVALPLNNQGDPINPSGGNAMSGAIVDSRPPGGLSSSPSNGGSDVNIRIDSSLPTGAEPVAAPVPRAIPLN